MSRIEAGSPQPPPWPVLMLVALGLVSATLVAFWFTPLPFQADQAGKVLAGCFTFALAMIAGIFTGKTGVHRPSATELVTKIPAVLAALALCLLAAAWSVQLTKYSALSKQLSEQCPTARQSGMTGEKLKAVEAVNVATESMLNLRLVRAEKPQGDDACGSY